MSKIKLLWSFWTVFKALRQDALRYRHIRSTKRNPERFDVQTDAAMAKGRLI